MRTSLIPFVAGTLIIYACGVAWLSVVVGGFGKALTLGVLPFSPGDAIKLTAAALALPAAWRLTLCGAELGEAPARLQGVRRFVLKN